MSTDINLRSSYVRYKRNTGQLVRWLVNTVSHVAPKHAAPSSNSSNQSKLKRGGGKKGGQKQTPPTQPPATIDEPVISIRIFIEYANLIASANPKVDIPPAVYSLFDSVIHARRMVALFYHRLEMDIEVEAKNESHMAFIQVLEAAFDILGGTDWREARNKEEKEKREKEKAEGAEVEEEDPLKLSNRFAELEIEDIDLGLEELETPSPTPGKGANEWISDIVNKPNPGKGKKRKVPQQAGIVEDLNAAEEASFAVWCFFVDVNSMRTYLKAVWNKVGKGTIDLVTASVVTTVALEQIEQMEAAVHVSFPHIKDYPTLLKVLLRDVPLQKIADTGVMRLLDFSLFFPLYTLCSFRWKIFQNMPDMNDDNFQNLTEIDTFNDIKFTASNGSIEALKEEAYFLDQYLSNILMATEYAGRNGKPTGPRLGDSAFNRTFYNYIRSGKMYTRLVLSLQLLLDCRFQLGKRFDKRKYRCSYALQFVENQQSVIGDSIARLQLSHRGGMDAIARTLTMLEKNMDDWKGFATFKPSGEYESIEFPDIREDFLSENPWHLGLVYAEVSVQMFRVASGTASFSFITFLHLYNFLLHISSVVAGAKNLAANPLIELLCDAFGQQIFSGQRPVANFRKRLALSSYRDVSTLISDQHHRKSTGPKRIPVEKLILPSIVSTLHAVVADEYKLKGRAYDWIEKSALGLEKDIRNRERNTKNKYRVLHSLSPAQLLDKVCETLYFDFNGKIPIGRVDLWKTWGLVTATHKAVYCAVKDEFEQLTTKDVSGIPSEVDVDITGSIINLENFSHNPTMQRRIFEKVRVAAEGILSGVTIDQYLLPMPSSRLKGWEKKDGEKKEKDLSLKSKVEGENGESRNNQPTDKEKVKESEKRSPRVATVESEPEEIM